MPAIARAYVEVLPDTAKFQALVDEAVRKIKDPIVTLQADTARVKAEFDALTKPLSAEITAALDATTATAGLEAVAKARDADILGIAETTTAAGALDSLTKARDVPVIARVDVSAARAALEELARPIEVPVIARTDGSTQSAGGSKSGSAGAGAAGGLLAAAPTAAAIAGAGYATVGALGMAEDYRVQLRLTQVELGLTAQQMEILRKSTIDLGNDQVLGSMSANDGAIAYRGLARAGLDFEQSQKAAKAALEFSILAQVDANRGVEMFGQSLGALKVPAEDAVKFVNEFAKADQLAQGSAADLAESLFKAAPAFTRTFGPGARADVQASLAQLSKVGLVGSRAGMAMEQLSRDFAGGNATLAQAERDLTKAATERGITFEKGGSIFKDGAGNVRDYESIMRDLNTTMADRSVEERARLMANLSDETRRILPELYENNTAIAANAAAITAAGEAQTLADEKAKAYATTIDGLKGAFETLVIVGSSLLLPMFDVVGGAISKGLTGITGFLQGFEGFKNLSFKNVVGEFEKLTGIDLGDMARRAKEAFRNITEVVETKVVPLIRDHLVPTIETIMPVFGKVADFIVQTVIPAMGKIALWILDEGIPALMELWHFFTDKILPVLEDVARFIMTKVVPAVEKIIEWLAKVVVPVALELIKKAWDVLAAAADAVWPVIETVIKWLGKVVVPVAIALIKAQWELMKGAAELVWPVIKLVFDWLGKIVLPVAIALIKDGWNKLRDAAELVWPVISTVIGWLGKIVLPAAIGTIKSAFNGLKDAIGFVIGKVEALIGALSRIKVPSIKLPSVGSLVDKANPFNANGGYFTQATAGIFGEAGAEVILPLTRPGRMKELLAIPQVASAVNAAFDPPPNISAFKTEYVSTGNNNNEIDRLKAQMALLAAQITMNAQPQIITVPDAEMARIYAREHSAATAEGLARSGAFRGL